LRALLVDRDEDTRRMYSEYLRRSTWRIDEAADGREALAMAVTAPPDVIVTETRLPGISGLDLCALLRRDDATQNVPIVIVTADAFTEDVERAEACGADAVLIKPCLPERLASELRRIVRASHKPRPRPAAVRDTAPPHVPSVERTPPGGRKAGFKRMFRARVLPPTLPSSLVCPACDCLLTFERSYVGGVRPEQPEQWDYFTCATGCGTFQYRVRTRTLRKIS
jgi:CheY-like chemotaxis protein